MSQIPDLLAQRTLECGLRVHPLGIGCLAMGGPDTNRGLPMGWSTADQAASLAGLGTACQLGANLFDTADVYGHGRSERLLGHLVARVRRDSLVISSKVGYFAGTAAHPLPAGRDAPPSGNHSGKPPHTDYLDIAGRSRRASVPWAVPWYLLSRH
jgi:aryl-alcohol dehydrogenase-like predicted oxidoreductase